MRKLLNTLYVTSPEAYLACEGENVLVKVENEVRFRLPIHNIEGIVCFGYQGASPAMMHLAAARGVGLSFHTENGKFLARVAGPVSGNVLLRRKQYQLAGDLSASALMAAACVTAKLANSRSVLVRALRENEFGPHRESIEQAASVMARLLRQIERTPGLEEIRGIEGEAASLYFSVFDRLILENKDSFFFRGRNRRPPMDPVNALLSFLYALLAHDVTSALESVGIDPAVGFLHRDRPGRPSLALDLMEELRAFLADRLALTLINRRQIQGSGFTQRETGGIEMDGDTRKTVLASWQKRKQEELTHPFLQEKIPIGLIPYCQALLLARYLRGDMDAYPPFIWK